MIWYKLLNVIVALVAVKSVIIGSDFSFHLWLQHKKLYTEWYKNRQTFEQFLKEIGK